MDSGDKNLHLPDHYHADTMSGRFSLVALQVCPSVGVDRITENTPR